MPNAKTTRTKSMRTNYQVSDRQKDHVNDIPPVQHLKPMPIMQGLKLKRKLPLHPWAGQP